MEATTLLCFFINAFLYSNANDVTYQDQMDHIARKRLEGLGIPHNEVSRRLNVGFDEELIIGIPRDPEHLPVAEPILPGHTLLRPARGMLKSAIKFPHRDLNNGAGVYGNYDNIGIRYDGKSDRVLYSGFRRNSVFLPEEESNELMFVRAQPKRRFQNRQNIGVKRNPKNLEDNEPFDIAFVSAFGTRPRLERYADSITTQRPWFWKNKYLSRFFKY